MLPPRDCAESTGVLRKPPPPSVQGAEADSQPDLVGAQPLHLVFNLSCPSACAGAGDSHYFLAYAIAARCLQTASKLPQFPGVRAPPRPRSRPPGAPLISTPTSNHCALKSGVRRASSPFRLLPDALCWFQNVVAGEPPALPADPPLLLRRSASARCRAPNHHRGGASIGARLDHRAAPQCVCR